MSHPGQVPMWPNQWLERLLEWAVRMTLANVLTPATPSHGQDQACEQRERCSREQEIELRILMSTSM